MKHTNSNQAPPFQIPEGIGTVLNQDLIQQLWPGMKAFAYEGVTGKKCRFVFLYHNTFYAPFWFQVSGDGSIYFGLRDKHTTKIGSGQISPDANGVCSLNFSKLEFDRDYDEKSNHFSFHGSGKVHGPIYGNTAERFRLKDITAQDEIALVYFKELSEYKPVEAARNDDLPVYLDIPPGHKLFMGLYIAPESKAAPVQINGGEHTVLVCLDYSTNVGKYTIQFAFAVFPDAPWNCSLVAYRTKNPEIESKAAE